MHWNFAEFATCEEQKKKNLMNKYILNNTMIDAGQAVGSGALMHFPPPEINFIHIHLDRTENTHAIDWYHLIHSTNATNEIGWISIFSYLFLNLLVKQQQWQQQQKKTNNKQTKPTFKCN